MTSDFRRQMDAEIDLKVRERTNAAKIGAARMAFILINQKWPVKTGWSKANNRININDASQPVRPSERPDELGALVEFADQENMAELAKISDATKIRYTDTIHIGNSVSYSPDVGFEPGQGLHIYAESSREARAQVRSEIASGKRPARTARFRGR